VLLILLLAHLLSGHAPPAQAGLVPTPIGRGAGYQLPAARGAAAHGLPVGRLHCAVSRTMRSAVHVELFARGRVLLLPPGIGIAPPLRGSGAYVQSGRCRYPAWTQEPTGVVQLSCTDLTLGDLFAIWGQPLGSHRVAGFAGRVRAFVGGRPWHRNPATIPLTHHAQIVVELGSAIPPHSEYRFPPGL
jgi:hypothetical protein